MPGPHFPGLSSLRGMDGIGTAEISLQPFRLFSMPEPRYRRISKHSSRAMPCWSCCHDLKTNLAAVPCPGHEAWPCPIPPDFLWTVGHPMNSMRLSLVKAAHAIACRILLQEIRVSRCSWRDMGLPRLFNRSLAASHISPTTARYGAPKLRGTAAGRANPALIRAKRNGWPMQAFFWLAWGTFPRCQECSIDPPQIYRVTKDSS
jgi:hypothetical protein